MTTISIDSPVSPVSSTEKHSVEIPTLDEQVPATIPNDSASLRISAETFSCDADGKHTEITIPADAWDFENETVWLTQAQFAELYKTSVPNICAHIGNIFEEEELQADSTIKESLIVQIEGNRKVSRQVTHYNLEMLIALGYRIRSKVATKFRQWATQHLKELMTKGRTEIQPQFALPKTLPEALRAYAAEIEAKEKALQERDEALQERDEAIRTKAMIGSKREATAMATASAKSKECARLTTENDLLKRDFVTNGVFCSQLLAQNLVVYAESTLRGKCSKALQELTALMEKPTLSWNEWNDRAGKEVPRVAYHKDVCAELKQRIIDNPKYLKRF